MSGSDKRVWSPSAGMGTLTWRYERNTFTPDDTTKPVTSYEWRQAETGKPGKKPRKTYERAEWDEWVNFTTRDGEVHVYRRDSAPAAPTERQIKIPGL